jgi:hypothetical protein
LLSRGRLPTEAQRCQESFIVLTIPDTFIFSNEVKDYIEIVVDALDWIPVPYAATIQKVVRLLEKFADRACKR